MTTDTEDVSAWLLAAVPTAVMTQVVPGVALDGIVIVVVKPPDEFAVTVIVSRPQTLIVTVEPGL